LGVEAASESETIPLVIDCEIIREGEITISIIFPLDGSTKVRDPDPHGSSQVVFGPETAKALSLRLTQYKEEMGHTTAPVLVAPTSQEAHTTFGRGLQSLEEDDGAGSRLRAFFTEV